MEREIQIPVAQDMESNHEWQKGLSSLLIDPVQTSVRLIHFKSKVECFPYT